MAISRREIVSFTLCAALCVGSNAALVAVATGAHPRWLWFLYLFSAFRGPPLCARRSAAVKRTKDLPRLYSPRRRCFAVFCCCCCFERAVCADFKSYPKTIPTEIIYYRLGLTTQLKQWYAAPLHNFLYTFLRVKQKSMPFALLSLSRHLPPRLHAHTERTYTRKKTIEFWWIFFPLLLL